VELRGFEPLTSCMPYKALPCRDVAACSFTRSFGGWVPLYEALYRHPLAPRLAPQLRFSGPVHSAGAHRRSNRILCRIKHLALACKLRCWRSNAGPGCCPCRWHLPGAARSGHAQPRSFRNSAGVRPACRRMDASVPPLHHPMLRDDSHSPILAAVHRMAALALFFITLRPRRFSAVAISDDILASLHRSWVRDSRY
jgi:hypothetical protein